MMTREHISYLSAADRARLRSTIDIEALERFLAATPRGFHRFFFLACVTALSDEERQELGLLEGVPASLHAVVDPDAYWAPSRYHVLAGGLLNATMRSKWQEVEPSQYRGA